MLGAAIDDHHTQDHGRQDERKAKRLRQSHAQKHKADGHGHGVVLNLHSAHDPVQQQSQPHPQHQGTTDLDQGQLHHLEHRGRSRLGQQRLGKGRGHAKEHQCQRVVHADHSQQRRSQGTFGIVFGQHVHRRRWSRRRSQGTKDERRVQAVSDGIDPQRNQGERPHGFKEEDEQDAAPEPAQVT